MVSTSKLAVALTAVHGALLGWSCTVHSPTLNEPGHLVAGITYWRFGEFAVYNVNPPLPRMVAALPVMACDWEMNWNAIRGAPERRIEFRLGEDFFRSNCRRAFWYLTLARWACIPFSLLGALVCYKWAQDLYGTPGSLIALVLWCFSPNILAHAQLVTPDIAATSLGLLAAYTFWHWLKKRTWRNVIFSGVSLGLAELAKMTLVVFVAIWPILWLLYRTSDRSSWTSRDLLREVGMLAARTVIALYVVNLGYGFEGSFTRLGDFKFVSTTLRGTDSPTLPRLEIDNRFARSLLSDIPVPLPQNYVLGVDLQKRDFEAYKHPSYLHGEFSARGWWYYYLYALAIKVPLGTWLLIALAGSARLFVSPVASFRDEFVLLCPAVIIACFVSSQTGFSEHMRYMLPIFPFVFIWIGRLAPAIDRRHLAMASIISAGLVWSLASSMWVYPHSLSYFNELVGGPIGGPKHLIHSNVDWGQDLLILKRWLSEHPDARPLKLAYFGYFDPVHAGIEYSAPAAVEPGTAIAPGWYAISVNFVRGLPYFTYNGNGTKVSYSQGALSAFQNLEPIAMAGYSIYIYHVPGDAEAPNRD